MDEKARNYENTQDHARDPHFHVHPEIHAAAHAAHDPEEE
jgi:hypothetical protein